MKILVTGAGGYIGTTLCTDLLSLGHQVIAFDRFFFGQDVFDGDRHNEYLHLVQEDTRNLNEVHLSGVDVVVDLAALSNDPCGDLDECWTREINFEARRDTAIMAKKVGVKRYILASSCSVYGQQADDVVSETSDCNPQSKYAYYNLMAEKECLRQNSSSFDVVVLRLATVFGLSRRMRFDLVVNLMTLSAFEEDVLYVLGGGKQWRPLIHVRDVSRALCKCINSELGVLGGNIFNVGCENFQVFEIATQVKSHLEKKVRVKVLPDDSDKRSYRVSFNKAKTLLGFAAQNNIASGVAEIFDALDQSVITPGLKTKTVDWYKHLLTSQKLISDVALKGKLLEL